jgi:antitoxin component of MazEF toxin-antitoxin module
MIVHRRLRKIGNSTGILIPAEILHQLGWRADTPIAFVVVNGALILTDPTAPPAPSTSPSDRTP